MQTNTATEMQLQLDKLKEEIRLMELSKTRKDSNAAIVLEISTLNYQNGDKYEGEVLDGRIRHGTGTHTCSNGDVYDGEWEYDQRHGKGKISLISGVSYDGEWERDKAKGFGICKYANGMIYEGEWKNDHRDGWGKLTFSNGEEYEGEWTDDKMHGFGRWVHSDGAIFEGEYVNGQRCNGKLVSGDGKVEYEGSFVNGRRHGKGILYCKGLWKYQGDFLEDRLHGKGCCEWIDQSVYEGQWSDNQRHGYGKYTSPNYIYQGQWKNDQRHGKGTCQYDNGDQYEGQWKENKRCGQGKQSFSNGDTYKGEWMDDHRHGKGACYFTDNSTYEGDWKNNKRHGKGKCIFADGTKFEGDWEDDFWIQSPACAKKSKVKESDIQDCIVGEENTFEIIAYDEFGNNRLCGGDKWNIEIIRSEDQAKANYKVIDLGNGTYIVKYTIKLSGEYLVMVYTDNEEQEEEEKEAADCDFDMLSCCPLHFTAHPSFVSPRNCTIEAKCILHIQQPYQFQILLRDEYSNLTQERKDKLSIDVECSHQNGKQEEVIVKDDLTTDEIICAFAPQQTGFYTLHVRINNIVIQGSPFSLQVMPPNQNVMEEKPSSIVDVSKTWYDLARSAYAMDGDNSGWDSDDDNKNKNDSESNFAQEHQDIPIIDDLRDLWKLGKFQRYKNQKKGLVGNSH